MAYSGSAEQLRCLRPRSRANDWKLDCRKLPIAAASGTAAAESDEHVVEWTAAIDSARAHGQPTVDADVLPEHADARWSHERRSALKAKLSAEEEESGGTTQSDLPAQEASDVRNNERDC